MKKNPLEQVFHLYELLPYIETGVYRHFKGGLYIVTGVVWDADEDKWKVKYKSADHWLKSYTRSFEGFFREVDRDGYKGPAFTKVSM